MFLERVHRMPLRSPGWLQLITGVLLTCFSSFLQAQTVCSLEGPITAIDPAARTITALGIKVTIPATLEIDGTTGITGATLNRLLDQNASGCVRSLLPMDGYSGGTMIAEAVESFDDQGRRHFNATAVFVELAENILIGTLDSVDADAGTFVVAGTTVKMSPDPRFPSAIVDIGGVDKITLAELTSQIGSLVGVEGYFFDGVQYAVLVETDVVPQSPGTDTVRITRAQGRNKGNRSELEVLGAVAPFDPNVVITIYDAKTNATLGTTRPTAVNPDSREGEFTFRRRDLSAVPTRVRAKSTHGGEHEADVTIK
jgi:hypothetical protein